MEYCISTFTLDSFISIVEFQILIKVYSTPISKMMNYETPIGERTDPILQFNLPPFT